MRSPRTLKLLAAAGWVLLTGCATETLTDSSSWSYLPFASSKGGKGSGGHAGGQAAPTTGAQEPAPAKPDTATKHSEASGDEGWNEPAPTKAGTEAPGQRAGMADQATQPSQGPAAPANSKASDTAADTRTSRPLPAVNGMTLVERERSSAGLPALGIPNSSTEKPGSISLEGGSGPRPPTRSSGSKPAPTGFSEPTTKTGREPLRLPTLIFEGQPTAPTGHPEAGEPFVPSTATRPQTSLPLPAIATDENRSATHVAATPLPKGLTDDLQAPAVRSTSLRLPSVLQAKATEQPHASLALSEPKDATPMPRGVQASPKLTVPGAPSEKDTLGAVAKSSADLSPLPARAAGPAAGLPNIPAAQPAPVKSSPTPFRLSEWIANEALHQEWRRQQLQRDQFGPQARGAEQQRLRLILEHFLVRERSPEEPGGK